MTPSSTPYLILITLVAALGGLLFGYDTAVISGAIIFLKTEFSLNAMQEGWAVSSALIGCIAGVSVAGFLSDRFGRKTAMLTAGSLFLISAIGSAIPQSLNQFIIARIIGGMGIGVASMLSPVYIAEIAPPRIRGRLVAVNQFAIITGMLITYLINWSLVEVPNNWRWMLGSEAVPASIFILSLIFIPESPRWLFVNGKKEKAKDILSKISGSGYAQYAMESLNQLSFLPDIHFSDLWKGPLRKAVTIGVVLAVIQQITGINTILYYTPKIFLEAGWATTASAFSSTIIVGIVNVVFTVVALVYIDKWGRKPLLALSVGGMGVFLLLLGFSFFTGAFPSTVIVLILLGYVAFFMIGLGPGYWVLIAEIFPNAIRGRAVSVATTVLWMSTFVISITFPTFLEKLGPAFTFWLYAGFCILGLVFIIKKIPETKNKSLEEIRAFWNK